MRWGLATPRTAEDLQQWAGFPDWVLSGILLPWAGCTLFTLAFAGFGMTDDDLGTETEEGARVDIRLSAESGQVLVAFVCYLIGVAALGIFSHRYLSRGSFIKEYFLGNRGLGPWVLALTVAATAISGGTFMGFPSLIYSNGWIMALWISGYLVVPLTVMAVLGKRINQVARQSSTVTVPDVFRDRFASPALGITCSLLILFFLLFNLVAQFKAGGLVMKEAIRLPAPGRAAADADTHRRPAQSRPDLPRSRWHPRPAADPPAKRIRHLSPQQDENRRGGAAGAHLLPGGHGHDREAGEVSAAEAGRSRHRPARRGGLPAGPVHLRADGGGVRPMAVSGP